MTTDSVAKLFRDRLSGQVLTPPAIGTLVGRWRLEHHTTEEVFINSVGASAGDFLAPEESGHWHVLTSDGEVLRGTVTRIPDNFEAESVRTIGEKLEELTCRQASWIEWIDIVPLVPGMSDQVNEEPLEKLVREHFGHLEAVCRKPRAHLHVEVERVPVSKARRIPPTAVSYLAAHTEDWDRPLLRGVMPKRVLAEVRHDQIDIYENRVVARLLDNLCTYLNQRVHVLRRLLKVFREKEDYTTAVRGTYRREHRISRLWGESIDENEGRHKAESALKQLEWLKYKVMGLRDSPLYENIPRRAFVPTTLKNTNILTNDQHYRRVAELWREWAQTGAGRTKSPSEVHGEAQCLCQGLDAFAMLLVVRALDTLGYEPPNSELEKPLTRGVALPLRGRGVALTMSWHVDGTITIAFGERELSIVGLISELAAGSTERVREILARIREARHAREGELLVLFLASGNERATAEPELLRSLHTVGNDPKHALAGGGCLPISPWEIGSTERVARALRWFVSSARFIDYPLTVDVPNVVRGFIDPSKHRWLDSLDGGATLELRTPPQDYEWKLLNLSAKIEHAEGKLQVARSEHKRLSEKLREAVRAGKSRTLAHDKHDARNEVQRCEALVEGMKKLSERITNARERAGALLECPSCGTKADASSDFHPRESGCFYCTCSGCKTQWETRLCSEGHRYAAMLPSGEFIQTEDRGPGWEDRVYGCDLLALPHKVDGQWGFTCPECGQVS